MHPLQYSKQKSPILSTLALLILASATTLSSAETLGGDSEADRLMQQYNPTIFNNPSPQSTTQAPPVSNTNTSTNTNSVLGFAQNLFQQQPARPVSQPSASLTYQSGFESGYLGPSLLVQSTDPEIQTLARQIVVSARTDYEKMIAIHDWVMNHIDYDMDAYQNWLSGKYGKFDAITTLHDRKALCSGYSNLVAALLRAVAVKVRVIQGVDYPDKQRNCQTIPAGTHAWNEVAIDGRWVPIDTTFDAGNLEADGKWRASRKSYYLLYPEKFNEAHQKCNVMTF